MMLFLKISYCILQDFVLLYFIFLCLRKLNYLTIFLILLEQNGLSSFVNKKIKLLRYFNQKYD